MIPIITLLLITMSCSHLLTDYYQEKKTAASTSAAVKCKESDQFFLIAPIDNQFNEEVFMAFEKLKKNTSQKYSAEEYFILLTLIYLPYAPHLSSPAAQFTYWHKELGVHLIQTARFTDEEKDREAFAMPVFYGLEKLLKQSNINRNLKFYLNLIDRYFNFRYRVTASLEEFLKKNKDQIIKDSNLRQLYTRQGILLQTGEQIRQTDLKKLYHSYLSQRKSTDYTILTQADMNLMNDEKTYCNFEADRYSSSLPMQSPKVSEHFSYGISLNSQILWGAMSLKPKKISSLKEQSPYLKFDAQWSDSIGICKQNNLWFFSTQGRDPKQYLYHLFNYSEELLQTPTQIQQLLAAPRHLLLNHPLRIIFEASKATENELAQVLKMNYPIYNADQLGEITVLRPPQFIIDERGNSQFICPSAKGNL